MKTPKFKSGEIVYPTIETINDKVVKNSGNSKEYFEINCPYVVNIVAPYKNAGEPIHWMILVDGATEFVHEDSFIDHTRKSV